MSEPAQNCKNNAIFNQTYTQKLFFLLKWPMPVVSP